MISLVIPVYGVEKYIAKCLESVVKQEYRDFELLLVNDGTKDNSVKVIEDYLKDKDINWRIINKDNGGLASARNTGIREAKGEYIAFLDADDAISSDFLKQLLDSLQGNDCDFAFCNFEFVKEQLPPKDSNNEQKVYERAELLDIFLRRGLAFVVPSMFFRADFLRANDIYFNEKIKFSEDQPFIWNVILHSKKAVYLFKKMYGYYVRENSIMTSSGAEKIRNSYLEYCDYVEKLKGIYPGDLDILNMVIPRWSLGALYTSANLTDYSTFKNLYKLMDGRNIYRKVKALRDRNTTILALVALFSSRLMYIACRSVKL